MVAQLDDHDLRALFEHVMDGVLFTHPDGSIVAANPAACALLRGTPEQIIAAGRAGLLDGSDSRWALLLEERARTGKAHGRGRMRRLDGSIFECELSSSVFTASAGAESACIVMRDVSTEQRLVAELLRGERQWRLTVQHAATGIALVGLDGRWLHVNPALCRIVGFSESELLSRTFQDITVPEDLDADLGLLNQVVAGTINDYTLDKRYIHRDGRIVWVRLHVALVRDEQNEPLHFVSQIVDITARRDAAEQLAAVNDELARSNADLEGFAGVVAHDLKSPLVAVGGFASLLASGAGGELSAAGQEYAGRIVSGAQRMNALIDDLLAYAGLGATAQHGEVSLADVIDDLRVTFSAELAATGATIVANDLPVVSGDSGQVQQLFQNLLANALKFRRPHVPPRVVVTAEPAGARWLICFADNGIGIEPAGRERVFDMFHRLHPQADYPGTGIGLAISRRVVENHGGRISVASGLDGGSAFSFDIPRACM